MNDRIRQLAEQATTRIEPTATSGEGWIFNKEKFAQLIVAECAQDFDKTYMTGGETVGNYIRRKFGVAE
jgi:hypothetical protein